MRLALALLVLPLAMATHAHRPPPSGANDSDAIPEVDGCATSPFDTGDNDAWLAFQGLWDGDDYRTPYKLGPIQEGVTTRYGTASQAVFRSGRARITVQLDDAYGWERESTFEAVAQSLASMPGPLMQRLPPFTLDLTQFRDVPLPGIYAYAYTHCAAPPLDCVQYVVFPDSFFDLTDERRPVPLHYFGQAMLHELSHIVDHFAGISVASGLDPVEVVWHDALYSTWSESSEWRSAMAQSPCAVSIYAHTNPSEDFAESLVAWFSYYEGRQGRLEPEARDALRERLGKRFDLLDELMHARFAATD